MKHDFIGFGVAIAVAAMTAMPAKANVQWPQCWREDCPGAFLNIKTRQGDALVTVSASCAPGWRHLWRIADPRATIRQWLNADAANGEGLLCIPLHPDVDEIRITSEGGHCGYDDDDVPGRNSEPGRSAVLRRAFGGSASAVLPGCHAILGDRKLGEVGFGGIALNFADGYGFGDSYATDIFYGVYDGFTRGGIEPFGAAFAAIGEFNTYHYRIDILARGQSSWSWGHQEVGR